MTNLSAASPRKYRGTLRKASIDVEAATKLWEGSAIQENGSNGGAENLTGTGTTFVGIADESVDNTAGLIGAKRITYVAEGTFLLYVDNNGVAFTRGAQEATIYATDGNTFTTVSTNNQTIGKCEEVPPETVGATAGYLWVRVEGKSARSL